MECFKIREYLSEYIDGMLDSETKALLEDHLLTCKGCSEELASLKGLVKELGVLEPVKAPPDFLDNLHQRMESRFSVSKILSALFALTKVKIPFQLAAATTTAILVIVIFYMIQPVKETIQKPPASRDMMIEEKVQMHPNNIEAKLKQEVAPEKPLPTKPVPKEYALEGKPALKDKQEIKTIDEVILAKKIPSQPSIKKETESPKIMEEIVKEPEESHDQKTIVLALLIEEQHPIITTTPTTVQKPLTPKKMILGKKLRSLFDFMEPKTKGTSGGGPDIQQAQQEAYNGHKARIAVARFNDKTAKGWWTGQIGDGMAEMLATALFNTDRYIVLERQTLQDVLGEQDLGASGRVRKDTASPIGQVEGAELLVTGTVTEFEPGSSGIGGGIGGGSNSIVGGILGGIKKSHIAIDIRVIDSRTSRIVAATTLEGTAKDIAGLGGLAGGKLSGELDGWHNQPIEKALRIAIGEATNFIASQTPVQYYYCGASGSAQKSSSESTYQEFSEAKTIYVKGEKANIRADAGMDSDTVSTAVKGDRFTAIGKKGAWYHVHLDDGGEGYIHQNIITTSKPVSSVINTQEPEHREEDYPIRDIEKKRDGTDSLFSQIESIFLKVEDVIEQHDGKIISLEYDKNTDQLDSIRAEIPTNNYTSFCEELKSISSLQSPPPDISGNDQKTVQILIKLIPSM